MKEYSLLNGSFIPALPAYEYGCYIISAWARPEFTNDSTSVGIVYEQGQFGSIIQVQSARNGLISRPTQKKKCKNTQR
jgi:hypothetical protein